MTKPDQGKKTKKPPPSFDGRPDFSDACFGPMDEGDDTTRRAGAGISFEPMVSPFEAGTTSFQSTRMYDPSMQRTQVAKQAPAAVHHSPPAVDPFVWKLSSVPTLPELHPLERTAVFVERVSPSVVSERISMILRERSIEAEYEDEKAKVKCVTPEGVECRVRLYRGRGKFNHGIIVEVQRRFGFSTNFNKHVSAILDAADGMTPPPPPPSSGGSSDDALPLVSDSEDDFVPKSGADSLKMVKKMMEHGGYDSLYLALQTLISLTDAKKIGKATAQAVSCELLNASNDVGNKVLDLFSKKEEEEVFKLRVMSLSILANALEAVNGKVSQFVRELLRPTLLKELSKANSNPRAAHMAARCFEFLYQGDHDQGEIIAALESARSVGAARHAGLYQQTQRCLELML